MFCDNRGPVYAPKTPTAKSRLKIWRRKRRKRIRREKKSTFAVGVLASDTGSRWPENTLKLHN